MKKFFTLATALLFVQNCFAYSSSSSLSDWITFIGIVMIIGGILEVILFFKIWGMTNDIRALKKDYCNNTSDISNDDFIEDLRKNIILGNIEKVKKVLLTHFIKDVQDSFYNLPSYKRGENGGIIYLREENMKKSMHLYVDNLEKQFNKIGEELPAQIKKMETYNDFYNIFTEEDFTIKKAEDIKE